MNQFPPGFPPPQNGQQQQQYGAPPQQQYGAPPQQQYGAPSPFGQAQQAPQGQASIFAGMRTATIFKQGNYFSPGIYDVEIIRCKVQQTRKGPLGFIAELKLIASNNPKEVVGGPDKSWYQDLSQYPQIAQSELLQFVIALYGIRQDETQKIADLQQTIVAILDAAVSDQNILAGQRARLVVHMKKTKGKNADFSVHTWSPFDGTDPPAQTFDAPQVSTPAQQSFAMPPQQQQQFAMPPQQSQFAPQPQPQFTPPPGWGAPQPSQPGQGPGYAPPQQTPAPGAGYGYAPPQAGAPPQVAAQPQGPGPQPVPVYNPATRQWEIQR